MSAGEVLVGSGKETLMAAAIWTELAMRTGGASVGGGEGTGGMAGVSSGGLFGFFERDFRERRRRVEPIAVF